MRAVLPKARAAFSASKLGMASQQARKRMFGGDDGGGGCSGSGDEDGEDREEPWSKKRKHASARAIQVTRHWQAVGVPLESLGMERFTTLAAGHGCGGKCRTLFHGKPDETDLRLRKWLKRWLALYWNGSRSGWEEKRRRG